ncbi:MAG: ribokinase [Oscillospiraceae bacterium]|nr:ribokinase [Oscillospiraceae bacterium]
MKKVLCFGSLNIDYTYAVPHLVQPGETLAAAGRQIFSGGKGLNQSVALARAGLDVSLAGAVGEDGRFLLEELAAAGVDAGLVRVLPDVCTGHAVIQADPAGNNCILVYGGANRRTTRAYADEVLAAFGAGDVLVLQNGINELAHILRAAKEKGMLVAFTPAPMTAEVRSLPLRCVDYLFLNEVEGGQLLDGQIDPEAEPLRAARELRRRYTDAAVLLTLGERGSVYAGADGEYTQAAVPVRAVDTTGAGDTYMGYFLAGLFEGFAVQKAMRFASQAAAIAVTRPGASPAIPTRAEVRAAGAD